MGRYMLRRLLTALLTVGAGHGAEFPADAAGSRRPGANYRRHEQPQRRADGGADRTLRPEQASSASSFGFISSSWRAAIWAPRIPIINLWLR